MEKKGEKRRNQTNKKKWEVRSDQWEKRAMREMRDERRMETGRVPLDPHDPTQFPWNFLMVFRRFLRWTTLNNHLGTIWCPSLYQSYPKMEEIGPSFMKNRTDGWGGSMAVIRPFLTPTPSTTTTNGLPSTSGTKPMHWLWRQSLFGVESRTPNSRVFECSRVICGISRPNWTWA